MKAQGPERVNQQSADPYAADSDKEYTALEADKVDGGDPIDDGALTAPADIDAEPEDAYPDQNETNDRERELRAMLQETINRSPEALAAGQSRRRSRDPHGDLSPEARRLVERTTELRPDDLDMENLTD